MRTGSSALFGAMDTRPSFDKKRNLMIVLKGLSGWMAAQSLNNLGHEAIVEEGERQIAGTGPDWPEWMR